jgi:Icc protein
VSKPAAAATNSVLFVQISDSHIDFSRPENPDVLGTFGKTIAATNALPQQPAFVVHTGDATHLSRPAHFDAAKQVLPSL